MVSEEQESEMELASEKIPVPPVENVVEESVEDEVPKAETVHKKPRRRHRELHASILKQMEFYFGDANLNKDRFLAKLITEDPWVDLNIFIKFNKIAALTTDVNRIAKALRDSEMLSVSDDGNKVRRITPISKKENSDECTVYVQKLPPEADHEWISKMFSQYGSIDYISIPKYKNKAIKGFAFVEYSKVEDVEKCIKAFKAKGGLLPSETTPNTLLSITTHENCDEEIAKTIIRKKEIQEEEMETENVHETDSKTEEISQNEKKKKKRLSVDETANDDDEYSKKSKRRKHGNSEENSDSTSNSKMEKDQKKGKKRKAKNVENASDGNEEVNDSSASDCDKKQKEKKAKHKFSESESKKSEAESDPEDIPKKMKKMDNNEESDSGKKKGRKSEVKTEAKTETKTETKMETKTETKTEAKSEAKTETNKEVSEEIKEKEEFPVPEEKSEKKKKRKRKRSRRQEEVEAPDTGLEIMAKKEWKRLRNRYLDMQKAKMHQLKQHLKRATWHQWSNTEKVKTDKEEISEKSAENKEPRFSFTPGVIIKIEMESPCSDPQNFKMEIKGSSSSSSVKYVDVREGSNVAFVRFDSVESAKSFAQKTREDRTMAVLEGDEEKAYWDKMTKDRKEKIENNIRVKQRGRDKLLKKAEKELGKHIKFDEV